MRLIDADKLLDILKGMHGIEHTRYDDGLDTAEAVIDVAETIDPVKHGHWYGVHDCPMFSECLEYIADDWDEDYELYKYCPHCGALMDEPISDSAYGGD